MLKGLLMKRGGLRIEITNSVMLSLPRDKHRFCLQHHHHYLILNAYMLRSCKKKEEAGVVNIEIYAALGQAPKDMPASGQALKDGCK